MPSSPRKALQDLFDRRFSDAPENALSDAVSENLLTMAARGSCRSFKDQRIAADLLQTLAAIALAAPSKSDLQQRDIIFLSDPEKRQALARMVPDQPWVGKAPMIAIFCGNNRRQRLLHRWRKLEFANDHLDAFFNAAVDAGIALASFVTAAEAAGLGCCPISAVRNEAKALSEMLDLPDHVFPVAGLAIGYPVAPAPISKRLPFGVTVHLDKYDEQDLRDKIETYGSERSYDRQRHADLYGTEASYGWVEDKVRQYSLPERADFGAFVRAKGFRLD